MSSIHSRLLILSIAASSIANAANPPAIHSSSPGTTAQSATLSPSLSAKDAPCNPEVLSAVYAHMLRIKERRSHPEAIPANTDAEQRNTDLVPLYLELIHWRRAPAPSLEEMNQLLGNIVAEGNKPILEVKFKAPMLQTVRYEFSEDGNGLQFNGAITGQTLICTPGALAKASKLDIPPNHFDSSVVTLPKSILNGSAQFSKVSPDCISAVKKIYASGGNLALAKIKQNAMPLAIWNAQNKSPFRDYIFSHYTYASRALSKIVHQEVKDRGQAQMQIFQERSYDEIFKYLHSQSGWTFLKKHYMAADPLSSKHYGPYRVTMELDPRTPVLDITTQAGSDAYSSTYNELVARYSSLEKCTDAKDLVADLAVEDSGIGLIAYRAVAAAPVAAGAEKNSTWFETLDSRYITGSYGESVE